MKRNKCSSLIAFAAALVATTFALPSRMPGQTLPMKSSDRSEKPVGQWSVQVDQIDAGSLDLSYSFQIAIYEYLVGRIE